MPLLKPRKWEILVNPYLETTIGQEKVKIFPSEGTEFGVPRPSGSEVEGAGSLLPIRSPAKEKKDFVPLGYKKSPTSVDLEYNWEWSFYEDKTNNKNSHYYIDLPEPYTKNNIKLYKTKKVGEEFVRDGLIPSDIYTVNIDNKTSRIKMGNNIGKVQIDVIPMPPPLPVFISYFETYSYDEALAKFYELVKEIGQDNVELKEVIPFDLNILPRY